MLKWIVVFLPAAKVIHRDLRLPFGSELECGEGKGDNWGFAGENAE